LKSVSQKNLITALAIHKQFSELFVPGALSQHGIRGTAGYSQPLCRKVFWFCKKICSALKTQYATKYNIHPVLIHSSIAFHKEFSKSSGNLEEILIR